jgi:fibronectin type 3 domain-containing protein
MITARPSELRAGQTRARRRLGPLALSATVIALLALSLPAGGALASDEIDLVGQISVEHADGFAAKAAADYTVLETSRGRYMLEGPKARGLHAGTTVRIHGKLRGQSVVLDDESSVGLLAAAPSTQGTTADATVGTAATAVEVAAPITKRVAVLLINFTSPTNPAPTGIEPWTKSFVNGVYFTNTSSVASYYSELSHGQMAITGDVFGYFTVAVSTSTCDQATWGQLGRQAAKAAGIDLTAYDHIVHAFPRQSSCWWGGYGQLPGKYSWVNGMLTTYITSHELGHNFGTHHASTLTCTKNGVRVAYSTSCTTDEYGDPFDVMGTDATRLMQGWHRKQMGLLGTVDQQTVSSNGRYTVTPVASNGGAPRILRVARPAGDYYYLEFRQPFGQFDAFSATAAVVNGVTIRIAPASAAVQSKLIDTRPDTTTFNDAALGVGQTFSDTVNGISISTLSVNSAGAEVQVSFGTTNTGAPTPPANLTASAASANSVKLAWTAPTNDPTVTGYRIKRDGVVIANVSGTTYTDTNRVQGVSYLYSVRSVNSSNTVSEPISTTFALPDTTPPGAPGTLLATQTGARAVALSWGAATDNVAVTGYAVRRNGSLLSNSSATSLTDTTVSDGFSYQYEVRAFDAAGNVGLARTATLDLPDVSQPTAPSGLTAVQTSSSSATLSWQAATDNVAVAGYRITRNGALVSSVGPAARSLAQSGLTSGTPYSFSVAAFDAAGNVGSPASTSITLQAPDTTPPSVPANLTGQSLGYRRIGLSWQASRDDRGGTIKYRILRNGVAIATVTDLSYVDRPATTGTYGYKVRAIDAAGNRSAFTPEIKVKAVSGEFTSSTSLSPDTKPPSVPQGLTGVALGRRYVSLSWKPSTDDRAGTIRYVLKRDGVIIAKLTTTDFVDRPATTGTYGYKVRAIDAAGNKSTFSVIISVKAVS